MSGHNALDVATTGINITTSGTSASGTIPDDAGGAKPNYVVVTVTEEARVRWGTGAQTALATDLRLTAGDMHVIRTAGADTFAAIQDSAAGTVSVCALEWSR